MRGFSMWHHYAAQHSGTVVTIDPAAAFGAAVCLLVLTLWAAAQMASRCGECAAVPVRCRCGGHTGRD